jgi:hypothetical protein
MGLGGSSLLSATVRLNRAVPSGTRVFSFSPPDFRPGLSNAAAEAAGFVCAARGILRSANQIHLALCLRLD